MNAQQSRDSARRQILLAVVSILLGEIAIMLVLGASPPMSRWRETLLDAGLLGIPVVAGLYFFVYRGLVAHLSEATRTSSQAQGLEERNLELFAANPHPMWFYDAETLTFLAVNDAAIAHYGFRRDEFLRMTIGDIRPPEDRDQLSAAVMRAVSNPSVNLSGVRHRKKDGTLIDVEITSHETTFRGRPARLVMVFDLTDRKRAELAIGRATNRLALHIAQTPLAVIEWDLDFRVVQWNPAAERIFGYTAAEAVGQDCSFIVPEGERPALEPVRYGLIAGHGGERSTNENVRKDGSLIVCEWYNTSLVDADGKVVAAASQVEDITERKESESALRMLQRAVDTSGEAIFITDTDGLITYVNPAFTSLYGFSADEVVSIGTPRILKSGLLDQAAYESFWRELLSGQEVRGEILNRRKDGTIIPVDSSASAIMDEAKRITGFLCVQRDASDRKNAEQALRASEARYRAVSQSAHDAIITIDPTGMIVGWNWGAETIFGYTEVEAIGQPLSTLMPSRYRAAHLAGINWLLAGRERHVIGETVELEGLRKDGSEFPLDLSLAQWESAEGTFVTGILRDITARVQEQAALRLQSAALNAAANPMVITNCDGSIEWVNEAFTSVTLYGADEARGRELRDLLSWGAHDEPSRTHMRKTVSTGAVWQGEMTSRRKDGSCYPDDVTVTAVKDAFGDVMHYITITRDLTDEKARHEQFLQAQKMDSVGRLAGGIAHDFNNLLTVINNTAEMAAANVPEGDPMHVDLKEIHRAGERAAALTAQLLSFSRKQIVKAEIVNLNTLVGEMRPMLARLIGEDIQLAFAPAEGGGNVRADRGQLEQVVMNLVVNARDAMPTGGVLSMETRDVDLDEAFVARHVPLRPGNYVVLVVKDHGIGMDEATRQRIFEPFFTTKDQGQGTGLGLATVYGIVQQSGGCISVDSELGQGTSFTIYLPRVTSEVADPPVARTEQTIRGSETILIVEDDPALLRMSTRILRSVGYQVLTAAEGTEALRVLQNHDDTVHLLLTDVVMPGMGGRELAGWLTEIRPEIRILYTSGYTDDAILRHGVLQRTAHFISKPYKRGELTQKIRAVLDGPPMMQ
jgi:PAS domain S-box-containing protein